MAKKFTIETIENSLNSQSTQNLMEELKTTSPASLYLNKGFTAKEKENRTAQMHFYTTPSIANALKEGAKANHVPLNEYINQILANAIGGNN